MIGRRVAAEVEEQHLPVPGRQRETHVIDDLAGRAGLRRRRAAALSPAVGTVIGRRSGRAVGIDRAQTMDIRSTQAPDFTVKPTRN